MKKLYLGLISLLSFTLHAQVKIGTNPNNINTYSLLELESTNKGLLLPRVNSTNLSTMTPPDGMIVYNISDLTYYVRVGGNWVKLIEENTAFKIPASKTLSHTSGYLLDLFNTAGEAGWGAIRGQSLANGNGVTGFSTSGSGVSGSSTNGTAGFFSSSSGYALTTGFGNVGIGTASPAYLLDVNGRMRLRYNGNTSGIWFNKAANTEASFVGQINDTTFGIYDNVDGWRYAFNHSNGYLGIGTTTPKYPLVFASSVGDKISFYGGSTSSTTNHYGIGIQGSLLQFYVPSSNEDIAFGTGRSGSFNEQVRITGDGNIGVQTSAPDATLHVKRGTAINGTAQFEGTTYSSHFNYATTEDTYLRGGKSTSKVFINDLSTGDVSIANGGGSLGIGTLTPATALHVRKNSASLFQIENSNNLANAIGADMFFKTNNYYTAAIRGYGTSSNTANLAFYTYASASSSGLVERLTIKDNGNVGINNNNPGNRFEVLGKTKLSQGLGDDAAIEISGPIKVSGTSKAVFVLTCDGSNLSDNYNPPVNYVPGNNYHSVIIDNALCNGDPNAMIFATPIERTFSFGVFYDNTISKWKIRVNSAGTSESNCYGLANPQGGACGASYVAVMGYSPQTLYSGDKFNIMIVKQ